MMTVRDAEEPTASSTGAGGPADGPRAPVLTAVGIVLALLLVAAAWFGYQAFTSPLSTAPDRAELSAIDAQLVRIEDAIRPIAVAMASRTATEASGVIDVDEERSKVASVRDLVDSTSDVAATSPTALEIRDLVLTGGSQVVGGMDQALAAMAGDDTAGAVAAAARVEAGLANLQAARVRLDAALGRIGETGAADEGAEGDTDE